MVFGLQQPSTKYGKIFAVDDTVVNHLSFIYVRERVQDRSFEFRIYGKLLVSPSLSTPTVLLLPYPPNKNRGIL